MSEEERLLCTSAVVRSNTKMELTPQPRGSELLLQEIFCILHIFCGKVGSR